MKAWTDYPILMLGDTSSEVAPIRSCAVLSYDGDKYCKISVEGIDLEIKSCYLYESAGRFGEVKCIDTGKIICD